MGKTVIDFGVEPDSANNMSEEEVFADEISEGLKDVIESGFENTNENLDDLINKYISERTDDFGKIKSLSDEEFKEIAKRCESEWEKDNYLKIEYDSDFPFYNLVTECFSEFENEQAQKQAYYGVTQRQYKESILYEIGYSSYRSVEDISQKGFLTKAEAEKIARKSERLVRSAVNKFASNFMSSYYGLYEKDDLIGDAYMGLVKALNTYNKEAYKNVSFSTYSYVCIKSAIYDRFKSLMSGKKRNGITVSSNELQENSSNGLIEESVNQENQFTEEVDNKATYSTIINDCFEVMRKNSTKHKQTEIEINVIRRYFGIDSEFGAMSIADISTDLGLNLKTCRNHFDRGMNKFRLALEEMGIQPDILSF